MVVKFVLVGRPKAGALANVIEDYETRAARYWPLQIVEVREERGSNSVTPAVVKQREGERLLAGCQGIDPHHIVACDPNGISMSSEKFAKWLQDRRDSAQSAAFLIGGAHGLSDEVLNSARVKLSVAPWTLTHELARLILAEQLYRAGTILRGEPYHK